jgi:hypothetical protein
MRGIMGRMTRRRWRGRLIVERARAGKAIVGEFVKGGNWEEMFVG